MYIVTTVLIKDLFFSNWKESGILFDINEKEESPEKWKPQTDPRWWAAKIKRDQIRHAVTMEELVNWEENRGRRGIFL